MELQDKIAKIQDSIEYLKKINDSLAIEEKRLIYDFKYLERIARESLGMIRPGEKVFKFHKTDSLKNKDLGKDGKDKKK